MWFHETAEPISHLSAARRGCFPLLSCWVFPVPVHSCAASGTCLIPLGVQLTHCTDIKLYFYFAGFTFCQLSDLNQLKGGQWEVQGGTRTWGILPSDSNKLLKWLRHLARPHPKGMTLLNRLIQIKSLLLQREVPVIIWSHVKLIRLTKVAENYLGWWLFWPG